MKKMKCAAGLLSAALLIGSTGLVQAARAYDVPVPASVVATSTTSYSVKVTADSLNIRKSANKDSDITGILKKGDACKIVDEKTDSRGVIWGKLDNGKGWINLGFTTKGGPTGGGSTAVSEYKVRVTAESLNIRAAADKNANIKGVLKKGDIRTIVAHSVDGRGVTWGKLDNSAGWINLSFTSKNLDGGDSGSGSSSVSYTVKVTSATLNIRKTPNGNIVGALKKGDTCKISGEKKVNGLTWGKLDNGKGWICLKYTSKVNGEPSFAKYTVKVVADSLYIRSKADKNSSVNGVVKKGTSLTIVAEQKDSRGYIWGKLSDGSGWVSLRFTTSGYYDSSDRTPSTSYKVQVTSKTLNIRKSASGSSAIVGYLVKGNVFTIVEEKTNGGLTWGKLSNGDGWICLKYTKKV